MAPRHSFRFADASRTDDLATRLERANLRFTRGRDGTVWYAAADEERIENDFLVPMRDKLFDSWQLLSCPRDWAERYRQYMTARNIRFEEESSDDRVVFCISREYRPHTWKLPTRPRAVSAAAKGVVGNRAVVTRRRAS